MKAIRLRTEYLSNPMGIDVRIPRFFWNCEGGKEQTAYRIICSCKDQLIWDSGKVSGSRMTQISYEGKPLSSRDYVEWQVTLWDENQAEEISEKAFFEMGLLEEKDWKAAWITGTYMPETGMRYPADYFGKTFSTDKELEKARLYVTACGLYEVELNGERAGDFVLAPGSTDYRKRIHYQTYDVKELINQGKNELKVVLGDGWYRGGRDENTEDTYGKQTKLLLQLELYYTDGTNSVIVSDQSFTWSNDGPIRYNDMKNGEVVEAARIPSYSRLATETTHEVVPTASNNVPVVERERFKPVMITTPSKQKVLDFGQNLAGYLEFALNAKETDSIKLRFGETLDEHGEFTQENFQMSPNPEKPIRQEVVYSCKNGENRYKSKFCVFGFRYVLVETEAAFNQEDFTAIAVYSDMEQTGYFTSSHSMINRLFENTLWSMKGNFLDVPTDCPTRERNAWTGDAQIFAVTGNYLMDTTSFYPKWMKDVRDGIRSDLCPGMICPNSKPSFLASMMDGSVGWADCVVLLPYRYYKMYGDIRLLRDYYPVMKDYAGFLMRRAAEKDFDKENNPYEKYTCVAGYHYGEWLEPEPFKENVQNIGVPHPEEATAYLHYTMKHLAEIANLIGEVADAELYQEYADGARKAYQYVAEKQGDLYGERPSKLLRPLAMHLLDEAKEEEINQRFLKVLEGLEYRVFTGFLSTVFMLPYLTEAGHTEIAYKILEQEEKPGWLYEVKQGATTIWETWDGKESQNHYSIGAVSEWLFAYVCGIRVDGENHFVIEPCPGGTLEAAKASYKSIFGTVESAWSKKEGTITYSITVPANTTATLKLPGKDAILLDAGCCEL